MALFSKMTAFGARIKKRVRRYINCLLENSHDYHTCFYPGNTGFLTRRIIHYFTSRLIIDDSNLAKLSGIKPGDIVIYTSKYKSLYNFLFFHTRLKNLGLPYPQIGFDYRFFFLLPARRVFRMLLAHLDYFFSNFKLKDPYSSGYIRKVLLEGRAGFISLIEEQDFQKRFVLATPDPLAILISLQESCDQNIFLVPQDIIFSSKPEPKDPGFWDVVFGTSDRPGKIKRLISVIRNSEKIKVEFSDPIDLKAFLNRPDVKNLDAEFQSHRLRSYLVDIINRQRKSITGPTLISRQEITEDILTDKSLREYLADYSSRKNLPLKKTHKKAAAYISEIAANYNLKIINLGSMLLTRIFKRIFDGFVVDQAEINRMREASKDAPLILVPCHKSHLDYLLLPYIMFHNNMPCPHIAAGKNLSFWPLGPLFRRGGAFFLRRTFKGAELYSKIFAAYLGKLLSEGFNIKIFIEGGRSRTGKTLPPRLGGLSMIIQTYKNKACENLYFVPIYIGYDRVLEEDAYLKEIEGGKKNPETLSGLVKARKFLKKKYGKVYMKFEEPISLKDYCTKKNVDINKTSPDEYNAMVKSLGYKLIDAINRSVVVTPHGLIAAGVLNCTRNSFSKTQLMNRVTTYMNLLHFVKAELADTLVIDPEASFNTVIHMFMSRNFIELADEDEEEITDNTAFIIKNNKRAILDYYKNSAISYFKIPAYTAIAILEADRFNFSLLDIIQRFNFLEKMFMDEFSFNEDTTSEHNITIALNAFINEGIIVPDVNTPDRFQLTSEGLRKLKWFAAFLQPFLESYYAALCYFEKKPRNHKTDDKERAKKVYAVGLKLYKRKTIQLKESLSLITYRNACRYFMNNGVTGSQDHYNIEFYKRIFNRLLSLSIR